MDTVVKDYRLRNPEQDVWRYIKALKKESKGHLLETLGSENRAYEHIIEQNNAGNIRAWYDATGKLVGLLMFQIGKPWWSDKVAVYEETVFCLDRSYSGIQREAIRELERIARANDAVMIFVGDIVSSGTTEKLVINGYLRNDYKPIAHELVKTLEYQYD